MEKPQRNRPLLILGGGENLFKEVSSFQQICPDFDTAAVNDAGIVWKDDLVFWATLHPEKMPKWRGQRRKAGLSETRTVSQKPNRAVDTVLSEAWHGASGLFAVQVAMFQFGYRRIVLAGIPMDETGHFWASTKSGCRMWSNCDAALWRYREGFVSALPAIKEHVRSMSGWTAEQLGPPSYEWLFPEK